MEKEGYVLSSLLNNQLEVLQSYAFFFFKFLTQLAACIRDAEKMTERVLVLSPFCFPRARATVMAHGNTLGNPEEGLFLHISSYY